jgi:hypothetical protein
MIKLTQNQFFGKLEYLPKSMPEGATYTCTDTKEIYLYSSSFLPELISTSDSGSTPDNTLYDSSWDENTDAATKNVIYKKIESLSLVSGDGNIDGGTPGSIYLTSQSMDGGTII